MDFYLPDLEQGQPLNGKQRFTLTLQQGKTKILPDVTTQTIGINQEFLGPVIRIKKGQKLRMEVTNQLNEVAALHWHGMILPATEDGGPHQPISPGKTWIAEWDVINEPSTLFYHSHTHQHTGSQVWRGLGGQMQVLMKNAMPNWGCLMNMEWMISRSYSWIALLTKPENSSTAMNG